MSTVGHLLNSDSHTRAMSQAHGLFAQLMEQPALLKTIFDQLSNGIVICDPHGEIVFVNHAAKRLLMPEQEAVSTAALYSALRQEASSSGASMPWPLSQALRGETIVDWEARILRPDGVTSEVLISSSPLKDPQQTIIGAVLTCVDITEQNLTSQQLQDMRHAQVVAQAGNWRLDVQHNRLLWSDETYRMFGMTNDTPLTYEMFLAHIHPDDQDYVNRSWLAALQGEPYDIEHRIVVGTQVKWVRERAELEFDDQGTLCGGFGTVQDITERKRAEAELRSVARFPSENPNPVLRVSTHGMVSYANEASRLMQSAWGCQVGGTLPLPWHDIVSRAICSGQTQELEVNCNDTIFLLQFVPIANHDYINIYGRDITTRKRAEERQYLLQNLVGGLAKALTPGDVATTVIELGMQAVGASGGAVVILNSSSQRLETIGAVGYPPSVIDALRSFPQDDPSLLARAVRIRQSFFFESPEERLTCAPLPPDVSREGEQAGAALPFIIQGRVLGALYFSFPTPRTFEESERRFLTAIANYCAQALERSRLAEQALVAAALQERQRFARDLHDAVSQVLFASTMIAETLPRLWERSKEKTAECLDQLVVLNHAAMAEMRGLLLELRPETIDKVPLETLLKQLVAAARGRKRVEASLTVEGNYFDLGPEIVMTFYRIAQESINNILKHSQATCFEVALFLNHVQQQAQLSITDNGQGFDPGDVSSQGYGLQFMCERAQAIGATLEIHSNPGEGTRIVVEWTGGTGAWADIEKVSSFTPKT